MESVPMWVEYGAFFVSIFMAVVAIAATMISYSVYAGNTAPEVIVYLEQNPDAKMIFNLVIKNIGRGPAKNVVFEPESKLPKEAFGAGNAPMPDAMDSGPIITGIPYMAPGSSRIMMVGQYPGLYKWLGERSIVINIRCERAQKLFGFSRLVDTSSSIDIYSYATLASLGYLGI